MVVIVALYVTSDPMCVIALLFIWSSPPTVVPNSEDDVEAIGSPIGEDDDPKIGFLAK